MPNYMLNNIIVDNDEDLINFALLLGVNIAEIKTELMKSEGKPREEGGREKEVV